MESFPKQPDTFNALRPWHPLCIGSLTYVPSARSQTCSFPAASEFKSVAVFKGMTDPSQMAVQPEKERIQKGDFMVKRFSTVCFYASSLAILAHGQIKVACIGNSITEGFGLPNASTQSYPSRLKVLLGTGYTVQNDGASGRTMLKSDARNSYWKFGKLGQALALKPDIVTIELGTNDANNFASTWSTTGIEFKRDYLAMIDTLNTLSPKPRVFVILPLPIRGNNDAILVKANELIKQVALERGLTVIDCYTPFKGQTQLYADGLHPNIAGADTMAHIVYRALVKPTVALLNAGTEAGRPGAGRSTAYGRAPVTGFVGGGISFAREVPSKSGRSVTGVFDARGALQGSSGADGGAP
ncbi:MAG: sialate O-acetylesterase [Fibrobacteres bacterium]|nr:sialate O-acetylesterase [Fibrobacterota bacterium]